MTGDLSKAIDEFVDDVITSDPSTRLDVDREVRARMSGALGLIALGLLMTGTCTCFGTWPVALVLSLPAVWIGASMRTDAEVSPAARAYAGVGAVTGALSLVIIGIVGLTAAMALVLQVAGLAEVIQAAM